MPDLLIIPRDTDAYFELEKLGKIEGYRVKVIQEFESACDWLKLRPFDVLLVDSQIKLSQQQILADLLWGKNQVAAFVSYSFETRSLSETTQARLFGAEDVSGEQALTKIAEILRRSAATNAIQNDNFPILVVEDLDSPRDIICVYLESLGFSDVTGVSSAKEALDLLQSDPTKFSCIVTDIRMPQMTGAEMIKKIRSDQRFLTLPIVVLTAHGTVDCLIDCLKNGASGFLVKPPKKPDMVRELGRARRIHASGRNARLASPDEAEYVQELLEQKGLV
jgi:two-component system, chemotaxis family, chemotaxis protein CheY